MGSHWLAMVLVIVLCCAGRVAAELGCRKECPVYSHANFSISISESEVIVRFDKSAYPTEVNCVEAAYKKLEHAMQLGDPQRIKYANMELHQSVLALLRAPSTERTREVGRW